MKKNNHSEILSLLEEANSAGLKLICENNGTLKVSAAKNSQIPSNLIQKIKDLKSELIEYLLPDNKDNFADIIEKIVEENQKLKKFPITPYQAYWVNAEKDKAFKDKEPLHGIVHLMYDVTGHLDVECFAEAVASLVERHESLRATFHSIDSLYYMMIDDSRLSKYQLEIIDLTNEVKSTADINSLIQCEDRTVSLKKGPVFVSRLLKFSKNHHIASFKIHHVVSDTWSEKVLLYDLIRAYKCFATSATEPLKTLKFQFKDYMAYVNYQIKENYLKDNIFWRSLVPVLPEAFRNPLKMTDCSDNQLGGTLANFSLEIPDNFTDNLKNYTQKHSTTLFIVLQATLISFLNAKTGQEEFIFGTDISGRDIPEVNNQIGNYAKTRLVRTVLKQDDSLSESINKAIQSNADMSAHVAFTLFDQIDSLLPPGKSYESFWKLNILFNDTDFKYSSDGPRETVSPKLALEVQPILFDLPRRISIDFILLFSYTNNKLYLNFQYDSCLYRRHDIAFLIDEYTTFTERQFVQSPIN